MTLTEVLDVYRGSDGTRTRALYDALAVHGVPGAIAVNLFRACKTSERAKKYRGGRHKGTSYGTKDWSLGQLVEALQHEQASALRWGWAVDRIAQGNQNPHYHILYVDLPGGQVSFHTGSRKAGPEYPGEWDRAVGTAPERICAFCAAVIAGRLDLSSPPISTAQAPGPDSPPRREEQTPAATETEPNATAAGGQLSLF